MGINEFTTVAGLQNARKQVLEKYQRGEISRADAEKALVEIDDAIAGSRGGSLARGGVNAVGGTFGGTAGAIAGLGAASVPVGVAGAIGGSMAADWLFGDAAERAGSWVSRQFGGGSSRQARRELDAIRPLDAQPGPRPQPGATGNRETTNTLMIANAPVVQGQPLSENQMAAIGMALQMSPDNARNYPAWVMEQYNRQKTGTTTPGAARTPSTPGSAPTTPAGSNRVQGDLRGFVPDSGEVNRRIEERAAQRYGAGSRMSQDVGVREDLRSEIEMEMRAEEVRRRRGTPVSGAVQTPDGRAMRPIDTQAAATAASATTGDSQTMAQAARAQDTQDNVRNLVERQDRTNELLSALLNQQTIQASDTRRTVDVLETLNNKS